MVASMTIPFIDSLLNRYTMYFVTIRGLLALSGVAVALSLFGILSYPFWSLLLSLAIALTICEAVNRLGAKIVHAAPSVEAAGITGLILFFLMAPVTSWLDAGLLALACAAAMASKYIFVWRKQHIFNPAAFGAVVVGLTMLGGAVWWVATPWLLPFVLVLGFLMARKIRRVHLFVAGVVASVLTVLSLRIAAAGAPLLPEETMNLLWELVASWPIIFFCSVMLTEPSTTPPTKASQMLYGLFVGVLSTSAWHIGIVYATPEVALLIGNAVFFLTFPKQRVMLKLKEKTRVAKNLYHFVFSGDHRLAFEPGQYLEWSLPHANPDNRGTRRSFTIASAPSEKELAIGVKIQEKSSTFKKVLNEIHIGSTMSAAQLNGEFTLPKNPKKKFVFIAGGIGITPFRSMVKELLLQKQSRDIILFYAAASSEEIAYQDIWNEASETISLKFIPLVGRYLDRETLTTEVPDWKDRLFYLSGPNAMVESYKTLLKKQGVPNRRIKTDYFPGF